MVAGRSERAHTRAPSDRASPAATPGVSRGRARTRLGAELAAGPPLDPHAARAEPLTAAAAGTTRAARSSDRRGRPFVTGRVLPTRDARRCPFGEPEETQTGHTVHRKAANSISSAPQRCYVVGRPAVAP